MPVEQQQDQKRFRRKSTRRQLYESLRQFDTLIADKSMKPAKSADLMIERAAILKLLLQFEMDERHDETTQSAERLNTQHEQDVAEIARLTQANAELQTRATHRVVERIPDDRVSGLQEQVQTLEDLLKAGAALARSVDIEARTRHAVSLIVKHGKRARTAVTDIGVDFSSVFQALQKSEGELLSLLQQAQMEGPMTPVYRAILFVKYHVQVDGHGKRQYPDQFDDEYVDKF